MNPTTILLFILFGFIVLWMAAWVWAIWRWSADILYGLNRQSTIYDVLRSAGYALLALLPLFVLAFFWSEFNATLPG